MFGSGEWRAGIEMLDEAATTNREQGLIAMEAFMLAMRSRLETVVGDFDAAAEHLDAAMALLPRIAPGSNQWLQVVVVPMLRDVVGGVDLGVEIADVLLAASEQPDTRWAGLALRLAAARGLVLGGLRRPGAGDPRRCVACARPRRRVGAERRGSRSSYAVEIAWHLGDAGYVSALERNVREKWLEPDLDYPEVDARWSYALVCALDGRPEDARHWFDEARRVLTERESEPLIVGVEYHAAEVELRFGADGDSGRFAHAIAEARRRCVHPAMAAWLPRLDELQAHGAGGFAE